MASGKNTCECPQPPGGRAVCSADQLAICRVVNGVAYTECIDVPHHVAAAGANVKFVWAMDVIRNQSFSPSRRVSSDDIDILSAGYFSSSRSGDVTFSLPESFLLFLGPMGSNNTL